MIVKIEIACIKMIGGIRCGNEVNIALLQETILLKQKHKSPSQDTLKSHVPAKKPTRHQLSRHHDTY